MTPRVVARLELAFLLAFILIGMLRASAAGGPLPRLAVSVPAGASAADVARILAAAGIRDGLIVTSPIAARVGGNGPALEAGSAPGPPAPLGMDADLLLHLVVHVGDIPGTGREREAFVDARLSEILNGLSLADAGWKGLVVEVAAGAPSAEVLQFVIAEFAVKARSLKPGLQVTLMLPADVIDAAPDTARRLVAYADGVAISGGTAPRARGERLATLAGGRPIMLKVPAYLEALVSTGSSLPDTLWVDAADPAAVRAVCATYRFLAQSLGAGFQATASQRAPAAVLVDGLPAGESVAFVSGNSADVAFLLRAGGTRAAPKAVAVAASGDRPQVACFGAADGRRLAFVRDAGPDGSCSADASYALVVASRGGGQQRLFEAVDVRGRAELSVEEIIARWQATREADRRLLDNYVASCFMNLHFQSGSFGVALDVALELQQFVDRSGLNDWIQTALLVNGVRLKGVREFPLPQLEPDRVVAKPLELGIDQKYRYRLEGTDTVNDRLCYVVTVEPASTDELLYLGRIWIDGLDFRQVRMQLEQRSGLNNVAAHVETQDFATMRDAAGHAFTLFTKIYTSETISLGGRPVMLERTYHFDNYAINDPAFAARLETARHADNPMFRDTAGGLRALKREGEALVVDSNPSKRIRALVGGLIVDGSLPFPVPLAGVSWVDFDYRGKGSHKSVVFAGAFLGTNVSRQRGPKLRTSVEFSLSALPSTLRVYEGDAEVTGEQIRMFEQTAGAIVNYQATSELTLSASSHLALHPFMDTGDTNPDYQRPSLGLNLRAWGELRYSHRSLELVGLVEPVWRVAGWTPYGYEAEGLTTPPRGYVRYDAELNQHLYVGKLSHGGVSAAYYGGTTLDRFSRYQSSFLVKPRIVGIPSGVDSFDAIGLAGVYYSFNVMDFIKLEASYNHAWARNLDESSRFRQFDGMDLDIGTAGPWGTYIQGAVGFTLRGNLDRYDSRWGAQVLVFKPVSR